MTSTCYDVITSALISLPPLPESGQEPLYVRLKRALRELIGSQLVPGDRLPSESELCEAYGLSRITARLALSALANEGVIERRQGKGTYVAWPKRSESVAYFGSFTEEMAAQGRTGGSKLVSFEVVKADPRVAGHLRIPSGADVYKIRRLRMADDDVICYQVSYLNTGLFPGLTEAEVATGSLYQLIQRSYAGNIADAEESVEIAQADPYRAELLGIADGAPLLVVERLVFSGAGVALEFNRSFYKGQSVRLLFRVRHQPSPSNGYRLALRPAEEVTVGID